MVALALKILLDKTSLTMGCYCKVFLDPHLIHFKAKILAALNTMEMHEQLVIQSYNILIS
jgi:hypothetical protein